MFDSHIPFSGSSVYKNFGVITNEYKEEIELTFKTIEKMLIDE